MTYSVAEILFPVAEKFRNLAYTALTNQRRIRPINVGSDQSASNLTTHIRQVKWISAGLNYMLHDVCYETHLDGSIPDYLL